ncbi:hypothetical protein SAMN05421763_11284 [[Luteovulum] sphaeroides subsp. megalophilum]|nr:hypothetical protein SAMN05421763_11284 [[Luteovulum] sphaeroides subsp. megalophilum]
MRLSPFAFSAPQSSSFRLDRRLDYMPINAGFGDPYDIGAALHLLVKAFKWVGAVQLGAVLAGERHVGQHVMLAGVHQVRQLGPAGADLLRDMAPGIASVLAIGLFERLPDRCRDNRMLAFGDMGEGIAHPVNPASLPGSFKDACNSSLQAGMGIADHELHAVKTTGFQRAKEVRPEGLRFGRANPEADDLAAAFRIGGHGDYGRHRDDPSALALLEIVRPEQPLAR